MGIQDYRLDNRVTTVNEDKMNCWKDFVITLLAFGSEWCGVWAPNDEDCKKIWSDWMRKIPSYKEGAI